MTANFIIVLCLGGILGLAIGLIGTGSVLAVPLLIYGAGLDFHGAVCVSMLTVTILGIIGTIDKFEQIDLRGGMVIAAAGMVFAPLGAWLNRRLDHSVLIGLFVAVVLATTVRVLTGPQDEAGLVEKMSAQPSPVRARVLSIFAGSFVGVIGGLLGISGGFIVVPMLATYGRLEMHRAVATSWTIVALVSASATITHFVAGQRLPIADSLLFVASAVLGFKAALRVAHRFTTPNLKRLFAGAFIVMSVVMLANLIRK